MTKEKQQWNREAELNVYECLKLSGFSRIVGKGKSIKLDELIEATKESLERYK